MAESSEKESFEKIFKILSEHDEHFNVIEKRLDNIVKLMDFYTPIIKQVSSTIKDTKIELHDVPKNILIVDDDPNVVKTLKMVLEGTGYTVDSAPNAMEALRKAKRLHFDLVIIDMNLPDTLGDELAQRLYEMNEKIRIIMITGYSNYVDKLEKNIEIIDVLMKPINPEALIAVINGILQKK